MSRVSVVILACLPALLACKKKPAATSHLAKSVAPDPPALPSGPIAASNGGCLRETSPLDGGLPAKGCGETVLAHATVPEAMTAKMAHKERCEHSTPPGVFLEDGCPTEGRIGGCSLPYKSSGTFTHWYYSGLTRDEIELVCKQQNRTFASP